MNKFKSFRAKKKQVNSTDNKKKPFTYEDTTIQYVSEVIKSDHELVENFVADQRAHIKAIFPDTQKGRTLAKKNHRSDLSFDEDMFRDIGSSNRSVSGFFKEFTDIQYNSDTKYLNFFARFSESFQEILLNLRENTESTEMCLVSLKDRYKVLNKFEESKKSYADSKEVTKQSSKTKSKTKQENNSMTKSEDRLDNAAIEYLQFYSDSTSIGLNFIFLSNIEETFHKKCLSTLEHLHKTYYKEISSDSTYHYTFGSDLETSNCDQQGVSIFIRHATEQLLKNSHLITMHLFSEKVNKNEIWNIVKNYDRGQYFIPDENLEPLSLFCALIKFIVMLPTPLFDIRANKNEFLKRLGKDFNVHPFNIKFEMTTPLNQKNFIYLLRFLTRITDSRELRQKFIHHLANPIFLGTLKSIEAGTTCELILEKMIYNYDEITNSLDNSLGIIISDHGFIISKQTNYELKKCRSTSEVISQKPRELQVSRRRIETEASKEEIQQMKLAPSSETANTQIQKTLTSESSIFYRDVKTHICESVDANSKEAIKSYEQESIERTRNSSIIYKEVSKYMENHPRKLVATVQRNLSKENNDQNEENQPIKAFCRMLTNASTLQHEEIIPIDVTENEIADSEVFKSQTKSYSTKSVQLVDILEEEKTHSLTSALNLDDDELSNASS